MIIVSAFWLFKIVEPDYDILNLSILLVLNYILLFSRLLITVFPEVSIPKIEPLLTKLAVALFVN